MHGAHARSLVVMAVKNARVGVTLQFRNMVESSVRDLLKSTTTVRRTIAQVTPQSLPFAELDEVDLRSKNKFCVRTGVVKSFTRYYAGRFSGIDKNSVR